MKSFIDVKKEKVAAWERRTLLRVLEEHQWNLSEVCRKLQVDRSFLYKLLKRNAIARPTCVCTKRPCPHSNG